MEASRLLLPAMSAFLADPGAGAYLDVETVGDLLYLLGMLWNLFPAGSILISNIVSTIIVVSITVVIVVTGVLNMTSSHFSTGSTAPWAQRMWSVSWIKLQLNFRAPASGTYPR